MGNQFMNDWIRQAAGLAVKPRVFVSYHHDNDQRWYDYLSRIFGRTYDIFTDSSVDRLIGSDDCDYQMRRIRGDYITGSSVTLVLCGTETWKRKFIDWEIKATIDKGHGLLGIIVPGNAQRIVPNRLHDNIQSAYAHWIDWPQTANALASAINEARNRATMTNRACNGREMMSRNLS